jgi:uncharacterized protein
VIVVADTGPLYALMDRSDRWHQPVLDWWTGNRADVVVPVCVLAEVCYLLQARIGADAEAAFVESIARGEFTVEPIESADFSRVTDLMRRYSDLPLGFVDATVIATAERLGAAQILSTDRRHFSVVRPSRGGAFVIRP